MRPFDPERLLRTLVEGEVRFVLIGGWAAKLQGSPTVTADIDICHDRSPPNLERLALALNGLGARLRDVSDDLPFTLDARSLHAGDTFTLTTTAGDIDLLASPHGVASFDALEAAADVYELDGLQVPVASIADLIAMKRAAGRPKDLIEVEVLVALREEVEQRD